MSRTTQSNSYTAPNSSILESSTYTRRYCINGDRFNPVMMGDAARSWRHSCHTRVGRLYLRHNLCVYHVIGNRIIRGMYSFTGSPTIRSFVLAEISTPVEHKRWTVTSAMETRAMVHKKANASTERTIPRCGCANVSIYVVRRQQKYKCQGKKYPPRVVDRMPKRRPYPSFF